MKRGGKEGGAQERGERGKKAGREEMKEKQEGRVERKKGKLNEGESGE